MGIRIRRFAAGDAEAIERLNARLAAGGIVDRVYPEAPSAPAEERGDPISHELYVAVDGDEVRGGVWLHEHEFVREGEPVRAAWLKYPVAESLLDRAYGGVPGALLLAAIRRQPQLMALGMGSRSSPIASLLAGLGWHIVDVPFYVAPIRAGRVFRELPHLKRSPRMRRLAGIARRSGLAAVAGGAVGAVRSVVMRNALRETSVVPVPSFGPWADDLWQRNRSAYAFIARRDAAFLNLFYPHDFPALTRLRVTSDDGDVGWVCVTRYEPNASGPFGELRVGLIVDAMGAPDDAATLLAAAMRHLVDWGADLVVTNQMHGAWQKPLRGLGFVPGPSNFLFAHSRKMTPLLGETTPGGGIYLTRGDCDGPPRW